MNWKLGGVLQKRVCLQAVSADICNLFRVKGVERLLVVNEAMEMKMKAAIEGLVFRECKLKWRLLRY